MLIDVLRPCTKFTQLISWESQYRQPNQHKHALNCCCAYPTPYSLLLLPCRARKHPVKTCVVVDSQSFHMRLLFNKNVAFTIELTSPLRIRHPQASLQSHQQASQSGEGAACPQVVCLWGGAPLPGRPGVWSLHPLACGPFSS